MRVSDEDELLLLPPRPRIVRCRRRLRRVVHRSRHVENQGDFQVLVGKARLRRDLERHFVDAEDLHEGRLHLAAGDRRDGSCRFVDGDVVGGELVGRLVVEHLLGGLGEGIDDLRLGGVGIGGGRQVARAGEHRAIEFLRDHFLDVDGARVVDRRAHHADHDDRRQTPHDGDGTTGIARKSRQQSRHSFNAKLHRSTRKVGPTATGPGTGLG